MPAIRFVHKRHALRGGSLRKIKINASPAFDSPATEPSNLNRLRESLRKLNISSSLGPKKKYVSL